MFSIDGKVAVITGAASGIGLATARRFAAAGARVVLADLTEAGDIASEIGGTFVRTDVSREDEVEALMRRGRQRPRPDRRGDQQRRHRDGQQPSGRRQPPVTSSARSR